MSREQQYSRRAWLRVGAATVAVLALAACGQAPVATSAVAAPATTAPVLTSAASGSVSTSASPSLTATTAALETNTGTALVSTTPSAPAAIMATAPTTVAASSVAATSVATSAPSTTSAAAKGSGLKLTLDSSGTQASYQVREQLAGHNFPSDAIGRTSAVTGSILLDAGGKIVPGQSSLEIDLRTLKSDQNMRDSYIQHDPLDTAQYPTATFVPTAISGMPWPLPSSGTAKFNLTGDFRVHGTTKSTTWAVSTTFAPDSVTGTATTPFLFTDFGMQPPHTMIALSVQNNGVLNLQFTAKRSVT